MNVRLIAALAITAALASPSPTRAADARLAIVGATVIDGTGATPLTDAVVLIEDRRISAVGPRGAIELPADTRQIDGRGKYVIPGLMDANVHLMLGSSIEFIARYEGRYEELIEEAAQVTLKNGLTTVFDSWGPLQPLLNVRDRIRRRDIVGSRVFVAGNIVGFSGPFGRDFNGAAETTASAALVKRINPIWEENVGPPLIYMTPEQVRVEIRKYLARGIDFLKYGVSGHVFTNFLQFSPAAQSAIIEETHKAGLIVQTHTTSVESLRQAIEAGVDMMQHAASTGPVAIPDSTIDLALARKIPLAVQPRTARRLEVELKQAEDRNPDSITRFNERIRHENQIRLIRAHVPLLLATDAGMMDPDAVEQMSPQLRNDRLTELGEGHFLWLKAMVEKGMTPMEAIVSATRNIAAAYHRLDTLGTIEKGKLADLVVLDRDPLQNIDNMRTISTVIKDGEIVDRDKLPVRPVLTRSRNTRVIVTTDAGDIELELDPARAPVTVANFLKYVDGGLYDGGLFHRTVRPDNQKTQAHPIEVVQGGINPERREQAFPPIPLERTKQTGVWHVAGAVSMARSGPDTARADFFICLDDLPSLDFGGQRNADGQGFAAFGRVVRGLDVVRKIQQSPADGERLTPPIRIVKVARKPLRVSPS